MKLKQTPFDVNPMPDLSKKEEPIKTDKYEEYAVDFHALGEHQDEEVDPNGREIDDWHTRHQDKLLDRFCDGHPSAPQCKVFDD